MRRLLLFFSLCIALATAPLSAKAPDGYYADIIGLKDAALKTKLHEIIKVHNTNDYYGLFKQAFVHTDVRSDGTWWDMYSDIKRYANRGWDGMNREHSFPKSWWGGDTKVPPYTDINPLSPSDGPANMAKSNYPLGEVADNGIDFDNGVTKVGYPVQGQGGGARYVFEPDDQYKGDFARTYFYMVTCYQDYQWKYRYIARDGTYPSLQGWAIELLLKWHRNDPVSDKETKRNDEVYRIQSNRNPFIDYPNLAEYIWGKMKGQPFADAELPPIGEGKLIAPQNNSTVDFGDIVAGHSATQTVSIRGSLSANLSLTVSGADRQDFSISTRSIDWKTVNESGYELKVTYAPKSKKTSNAKLLLFDGGLQGITSYTVNLVGNAHDTPTFDRVEALDATDISSDGFTANWRTPANPAEIDSYVINLSEYINGNVSRISVTTDGNEPFYTFSELKSGATYSYTVQSLRFGMTSPESNVINVELSGISGTQALKPLAIAPIGNGIRFICQERHTNIRIFDMTGRLITSIPEAGNGHCTLLPFGAFLVVSDQSPRPIKVLVKD